MLVVLLMFATSLSGCAAGQVMVASYEVESANCSGLDKEGVVARGILSIPAKASPDPKNNKDKNSAIPIFHIEPMK